MGVGVGSINALGKRMKTNDICCCVVLNCRVLERALVIHRLGKDHI